MLLVKGRRKRSRRRRDVTSITTEAIAMMMESADISEEDETTMNLVQADPSTSDDDLLVQQIEADVDLSEIEITKERDADILLLVPLPHVRERIETILETEGDLVEIEIMRRSDAGIRLRDQSHHHPVVDLSETVRGDQGEEIVLRDLFRRLEKLGDNLLVAGRLKTARGLGAEIPPQCLLRHRPEMFAHDRLAVLVEKTTMREPDVEIALRDLLPRDQEAAETSHEHRPRTTMVARDTRKTGRTVTGEETIDLRIVKIETSRPRTKRQSVNGNLKPCSKMLPS